MLTIDATLSPRGHMVVSCHSGSPDWGSGPTGIGKLVHIQFAGAMPQPVVSWTPSPTELRVAFDRPLDPDHLRGLADRADITSGRYVSAGGRYEVMRRGYQAVQDQLAAPRSDVPVLDSSLSADRHTLMLRIDSRTLQSNLAVILPGILGGETKSVDVLATLNGLIAEWRGVDGGSWSGWLPHPDLAVAREFTAGSAEHAALWSQLEQPSTLTLHGKLDLWQLLHPPIQEGAKLGDGYAPEAVTVVFGAVAPFRLTVDGAKIPSSMKGGRYAAVVRFSSRREGVWPEFKFETKTSAPEITAHWFTAEDSRPRALPLRRAFVPWAQSDRDAASAQTDDELRDIAEIRGGNWLRCKELFHGKAGCFACHHADDSSRSVGPDLNLMGLAQRDYASVLKDIREPSAAINPDFVGYTIELTDGATIAGTLKGERDRVHRFATLAGLQEVPREKVRSMQSLPVSMMPPGLLDSLSPEEHRDLFTFLLQPPFEPAPILLPGAPPPRKRAEVDGILGDATTAALEDLEPLRILWCAESEGGHVKQGRHDYPLWRQRWSRLLGLAAGVTVETAEMWPTAEQWQRNDVVVLNSSNTVWSQDSDPAKIDALGRDLDAFLARGGGLVVLHFALNGGGHADELARRIGLAWFNVRGRFRDGARDWVLVKDHPLASGFTEFKFPDESYWHLTGDLAAAGAQVLATIEEEGSPRPQMWTREAGPGRVFVSIPGHYTWTYDDPLYRLLILRGMMWSARQPIDRLAGLATIGARVEE